MKARIEVGTDIAMIGAWDATRNHLVVAKRWGREWDRILQEDVAQGHLFLIHTGADCGGKIDIYCESAVPPDVRANAKPILGESLICVPTGRLMVGGVEDYRSDKPQITSEESIVHIPGGNYALRCFVGGKDEGDSGIPSRAELEKALGADDYAYLRTMDRRGCLGYLILLLFPLLVVWFSWKIALPTTLAILLGFFYLHERALKRNRRYERVKRIQNQVYGDARKQESPAFIFELRRLRGSTNLKGGSVWLPLEG